MKRLVFVLLAIAIIGVLSCSRKESRESAEAGFKKLQQAACQSNVDEFLSRLDFESLLVSMYKEDSPEATEADIQAFKNSSDFSEQLKGFREALKKSISNPNNPFCKAVMKTVKSEEDIATIHVQEDPDNPYYIQAYTFRRVDNKWIWSSVDGFVNPPISATSSEIDKAYGANAIAADQRFKGKAITINGKVNLVDKDITGKVFIMIGEGIIGDVQCFVRASHAQKAAELKAGDDIEITGIGNGKLVIPSLIECVW
jgi:hypothetical protein